MTQPEVIPDEDHEQVTGRVCAIDVAKQSGKVCTRVPHAATPGRRVSRVWDVAATTRAVIELGSHLVDQEGLPDLGGVNGLREQDCHEARLQPWTS